MGKINILSDSLINKISAGEILQRPSSCVKELIENSIDANSTSISVELKNAGKEKIIISDNGDGISFEDLKLILKKHTTSKIKVEEDLYNISSFGFRGEAMSSIAEVSKVSIKTKTIENDFGYILNSNFLNNIEINKISTNNGTIIEISDIFHNTPARLNFLKTSQTELSHCINVFNNFAISYPKISFKLIHNNKTLFFYPKTSDYFERFNLVFKSKQNWLNNKLEYGYLYAQVFILDPKQSNKKEYNLFVNNRSINDKIISHALNLAFDKYVTGNYNTVILFLNIDPHFVDVNVSPSKTEIRFREPKLVHDFILNLIEPIFNKKNINPVSVNTSYNSNFNMLENSNKIKYEFKNDIIINSNNYRKILGQYKNQYIVYEENEKLIIADQHAVHERINYEKFLIKLKKENEVQILLITEILKLSYQDAIKLDNIFNELTDLGFEIEKENTDTANFFNYLIRSVPKIFLNLDINKLLFELITNEINNTETINKISLIAAKLSCHASVRGNTILEEKDLKNLLNELDKCEYPYTCPHGRPTKLEFSYYEIEKMFKRK